MRRRALYIVATSCCWLTSTWAAEVPTPGPADHRVRLAQYDPNQVYKITGYFGYAMTLIFDRNERILDVVMGDPNGWEITVRQHSISIKPKALEPDTSMVVLTDRREYAFDVRARAPRKHATSQAMAKDQAFLVRFAFPKQEEARAKARAAQQAAIESAERIEQGRLEAEREVVANMKAKPINRNYQYAGAKALAPMEAWDDGVFTFLRFSREQGIPAIYTMSQDGQEMIAPKHMQDDVVVIQQTTRKIILRRGALVTAVYNEGPVSRTTDPVNQASDPAAARILKTGPSRGQSTRQSARLLRPRNP